MFHELFSPSENWFSHHDRSPEPPQRALGDKSVPFTLHFSPPRPSDPQNDRNIVKWVVNRVDTPTKYTCLRAKLTHVVFNPLSLGCISVVVALYVFSKGLEFGLVAASDFLFLSCQSSNSATAGSLQSKVIGDAVLSVLSQSANSTAQQAFNSVNASLWNLQQTSHGYIELLTMIYGGLASGIPVAAYVSATNVTQVLGNWAEHQIEKAENLTDSLVNSLAQLNGVLSDTGLFSPSSIKSNFSVLLNTSIPTDVNTNLQIMAGSGINLFDPHNLSITAGKEIDKKILNASNLLSDTVNSAKQVFAETNLTFPSIQYECGSGISYYDQLINSITTPRTAQIAVLSIFALVFVVINAIYQYYSWCNRLKSVKELEYPESDEVDVMDYLRTSDQYYVSVIGSVASKLFSSKNAKIYSEWVVAYSFSPYMTMLLLLSIFVLILAGCQNSLISAVNSDASHPLMVQQGAILNTSNTTTNGTSLLDSWSGNVNNALIQAESDLNIQLTKIMSGAVNDIAAYFDNYTQNMHDQMEASLSVVNLTVSFNSTWDLFGNGYALEQVKYPLFNPALSNITVPSSIVTPAHVFSVVDVIKAARSIYRMTWLFGMILLCIWIFLSVVAILYSVVAVKSLPYRL